MDRAGVAKLSRPEKEMRRRPEEGKAEAEAVRQEKGSTTTRKKKCGSHERLIALWVEP
jgi:hypothetical protein